jgi:cytosine/adenosine deaminase-related metal-dependent hydrolase
VRYIKADKAFDGFNYLAETSVLVLDHQNLLRDIIDEKELDPLSVERYTGIVCPGFVNAHCHLELSHLKGVIKRTTGLPAFAREVITKRNDRSEEEVLDLMTAADQQMYNKGIVAVGDICNTPATFGVKERSRLYYHSFIELIGLDPKRADKIFEKGIEIFQTLRRSGLPGSLAAHAPYSTSKKLITMITKFDAGQNSTFCIHNQESEEETKFFKGVISGFNDLYKSLSLDITWFRAPGVSSLAHYSGTLNGRSLLVHNTCSTKSDIDQLAERDVFWCLCPGANLYIENKLPDLTLFKQMIGKVCVGTDSLASNDQLDVVSEANILLSKAPFTIEEILRSITLSGAEALGISGQFGRFHKNRNAGMNLLSVQGTTITFEKKLS